MLKSEERRAKKLTKIFWIQNGVYFVTSKIIQNNSYNKKWKLYNLKWELVILPRFPGTYNIIKTVQWLKLQLWIEVSKEFSVHKWLQLQDYMVLGQTSTASGVVVKTSVDKRSNIPSRPLMPLVSSKKRKKSSFITTADYSFIKFCWLDFYFVLPFLVQFLCIENKNEYIPIIIIMRNLFVKYEMVSLMVVLSVCLALLYINLSLHVYCL